MADNTKIEWTSATWNPVTGCRKVSAGCKHCYAEGVADRFWGSQYPPVDTGVTEYRGGVAYPVTRPRRFTDVQCHPERLDQPLRWRKPRRVFVNSMSDLFHEDVPDEFIGDVFNVMAQAERHTFQVLTKRPERMCVLLDPMTMSHFFGEGIAHLDWPLPNVWLGVSVEDQATADERIPVLLDTPAALRWVSYEPGLAAVDFSRHLSAPHFDAGQFEALLEAAPFDGMMPQLGEPPDAYMARAWREAHPTIDWIVVGGESGRDARPFDLAWARSTIKQGRAAGVPVFTKQMGSVWARENGSAHGHGGRIEDWPLDVQVREFPGVSHAGLTRRRQRAADSALSLLDG